MKFTPLLKVQIHCELVGLLLYSVYLELENVAIEFVFAHNVSL